MKKALSLLLALALTAAALAGCSGTSGGTAAKTPEELTKLYADAITANGGEAVEYNPVVTEVKEGDDSALLLEFLGLKAEDMTAFGISLSLMNVNAYAIAAVMPAEGKADTVKQALQTYKENQMASFEMYLADQYDIAKNAKLEALEDGTVLLVMCADQDTVYDAIAKAIQAG